jgi:hypothetical protein
MASTTQGRKPETDRLTRLRPCLPHGQAVGAGRAGRPPRTDTFSVGATQHLTVMPATRARSWKHRVQRSRKQASR